MVGVKSSIRTLSKRKVAGEEGAAVIPPATITKTMKIPDVVACVNESFGLRLTHDAPLPKFKEALVAYRERKDIEIEETRSRCIQYKELLKVERDKCTLAKEKIKLMVGEINSLREKLRTNKENELAQKSLTSQLLAYQILHKKDMESKRLINEELVKTQEELQELKKKRKTVLDGNVEGNELLVQSENEKLKAKNEALMAEYKRLKDDMDETVSQLIVYLTL